MDRTESPHHEALAGCILQAAEAIQQAAALEISQTREKAHGVNVLAQFCSASGLSEAARQSVRMAQLAGLGTSGRDIPAGKAGAAETRGGFLGREIYPVSLVHLTPSEYYATAYARAGLFPRADVYRIGVCWWELPEIPWPWLAQCSWLDELWAPTRFVQDALLRAGAKDVHWMLPTVEVTPFLRLARADFGLPENDLLFLCMFDICSVMARKNPLDAIHAFRRAFPVGTAGVQLVIKVSHAESDPPAREILRYAAGEAGVRLIEETMTRERSYALLEVVDCYLSLHRSEGFGICLAEAMLLGKPVIATAYSGNVDFMNADNSLLVDYHLVPVGENVAHYPAEGHWAQPRIKQAVEHLRWVAAHRAEACALGERARMEVAALLAPSVGAARLQARLHAIKTSRAV